MTPEKLAKIRALAGDSRGDPATRAIAQAALRRYAASDPEPVHDIPPYQDYRHPGVRPTAEYVRWRFMDLGSWRHTSAGNPIHYIVHKGRPYRIILFRHKKRPTYGWMRANTVSDAAPTFSGAFSTMAEAHEDAWKSLMGM